MKNEPKDLYKYRHKHKANPKRGASNRKYVRRFCVSAPYFLASSASAMRSSV